MLLLPLSHFIELLIDLIDGGGDVVQLSNGLAVGSTVFVAPPLQYTGNGSSNDKADAFSRSLWGLTGPSEREGPQNRESVTKVGRKRLVQNGPKGTRNSNLVVLILSQFKPS